jgi:hypothetical protein
LLIPLLLYLAACGRIGFDPVGQGIGDDAGADADLRCPMGQRFVNGACVACESEELSCGDGQDEDCDGQTDCQDTECLRQVCGSAGCATQVCEADGLCTDDSAFFDTSWEDGSDLENQGGCSEWTGTVGNAISVATGAVSDLEGTRALFYQGVIDNDEALYVDFPPQDRSSARFFVQVASWQADDASFRTLASWVINGTPNGAADNTALYLRLYRELGVEYFEVRYFNGVTYVQFDLFPFAFDTSYQVEMLHETGNGGGRAGWRVWSADGRMLIHERLIESSTSTRQANAFFLGNGFASGVTQNTEVYFDAVKLGTDDWLQPIRR